MKNSLLMLQIVAGLAVALSASGYEITLDAQGGGTLGTHSVSVGQGEVPPDIVKPTREGYRFAGYFSAPGGAGTQYYWSTGGAAKAWDHPYAMPLYAKWLPKECKVRLDLQGGSTSGETNVTATYGKTMPSLKKLPWRTGYDFAGFFSEKEGAGKQYYWSSGAAARSWDVPAGWRLCAHWTPKRFAVKLDGQGATSADVTVTMSYAALPATVAKPKRPGYTFAGYFSSKNGGGTQYFDGAGKAVQSWDRPYAMPLYAHWLPNAYKVTFDADGAWYLGSTSAIVKFGEYPPNVDIPRKTGYGFGGYWTKSDGEGAQYWYGNGEGAQRWNWVVGIPLYAKWVPASYTVPLDPQGGTQIGASTVTVVYGKAPPKIVPPVRKGYVFAGYWSGKNGYGNQYYYSTGWSTCIWDKPVGIPLYAKWVKEVK